MTLPSSSSKARQSSRLWRYLKNIRYHPKKIQNFYPFVQNDFHVYHLACFIDWCLKNRTCFPYGTPWKGKKMICFIHKLARWGGVHVDNMKGLGTFTSIFKMKSLIVFYKMIQTWKNAKKNVLDVWDWNHHLLAWLPHIN